MWVCFRFLLLFLVFDDFVADWTMYRSFTRSLLKPLNLQAAMYALISQLTLVCNMQLNVLDDLAEAMKAVDGKKRVRLATTVGGLRVSYHTENIPLL